MRLHRWLLSVLFLLAGNATLFAQVVDPSGGPATISADKNVYAAGEAVTLTGSGWAPGETVTIALQPVAQNRNAYSVQSVADSDGNFVNQDFVPSDSDIGTRYIANASGSVTGAIVQTQFTVSGRPLETGRPDVVRMHGPVSQDRDLRNLPNIPPRPGFEPRRLTRHPRPATEEEEREAEAISASASAVTVVDPLHAFLTAASPRIVSFAIPGPTLSFDGINSATSACGCLPPDTNGDVGPNHFIQDVNSGIRIFNKAGAPLTSFISFNAFFAPLGNSTPCGNNQNDGDGVVFYDHLADRWVITDFAFPGFPGTSFWQCMGVSKTSNPVSGGWWLYALRVDPANPSWIGDYPKFGLWNNAYYLTMNTFLNPTTFTGVRVYALDRASMLVGGGAPSPTAIGFSITPATLGDAYSLVPATFRYGPPPSNRDEYLLAINSPASGDTVQNKVFAWRFHPDFATPLNSVFGVGATHAPDATMTVNNFFDAYVTSTLIVPQTGTTARLDTLGDKLMHPLYYQNINGTESLWATHTINNNSAFSGSGPTAIRWYQFDVTGGGIPAGPAQQQTFNNGDAFWRWMPSIALDSNGNMAIDYTVSASTLNPSIRYAGRLATDPLNSLAQGEALLVQGAGHQTSTSGRWGDYSATAVDPSDGCTFWHTNEYFTATSSGSWATRIGTFKFPSCVQPLGTLRGTVTAASGGAPISGATVTAGTVTTTTDGSGQYSVPVPVGAYTVTANAPGFLPSSANEVVITANTTTTRDFALASGATFACFVDTSQADFQAGTVNGLETNSSPGDVKLTASPTAVLDQQQVSLGANGNAITTSTFEGQTFLATISGALTQLDVAMFCSACSATNGGPVTVEIRNLNGVTPGNTVLATTTIPGFNTGASTFFSAVFSQPARVTAGTTYAFTLRGAAVIGTYAATRSATNVYAAGSQFVSTTAGVTWTAQAFDLGFRTFISTTLVSSGDFTSSVKDANPATGIPAMWGTLAWTAPVPAGTAVKFQAAASNNPAGPFTFVGPGNDPSAFFTTTGASLSQFSGLRYLQYKAFLSSTVNTVTPTLSDVSICFDNRPITALNVAPSTATYGGTTTLSATLLAGATPIANKPVAFTLNGSPVATVNTNATGVASVPNVSVAGIAAGSYPTAVAASFATDAAYAGSSGANSLTISVKDASVTPDAASKTYGDGDPALTGTLSGFLAADGVSATYSRTAGETVAANPYTISATLTPAAVLTNYNITYNTANFTISQRAASVTPNGANKIFGAPDPPLTGTLVNFVAADNVTATYSRTGGESVAGSPYTISATLSPAAVLGNYAITYNTALFTIGAANATIDVSGYSGEYDGLPHGATGTATGVNGENLNALLNLGATFTNVPGGTANWNFAGNVNYNPASGSVPVVITQAPLTVTADDKSRLYGNVNPPLTVSYTGFKHGETRTSSDLTGAAILTTLAGQYSAAGPYPITIGIGNLASTNYAFTLVPGTLTVYLSGLVGLDSAYVGATKAVVDSFDSTQGYASSIGSNAMILSNGLIEIAGAKIYGGVQSTGGAVTVALGSQVSGNVTAATTITNAGTINGTQLPGLGSAPLVGNAVPPCSPFTANPSITGGKFTYANGDLTLASGATFTFANGSYCFRNLTVAGNATLRVNGPVTIRLTGVLNTAGGSMVNATQVPSKLQFASSYNGINGVTIAGNTAAYLSIYAPKTSVTVTGGSPVFGALLGKTLTITGNSQVHYDVLLDQIWSIFGF